MVSSWPKSISHLMNLRPIGPILEIPMLSSASARRSHSVRTTHLDDALVLFPHIQQGFELQWMTEHGVPSGKLK